MNKLYKSFIIILLIFVCINVGAAESNPDSEKSDILSTIIAGSNGISGTWEILAMVLAGIGLFLTGIRFVSDSMKRIANRKLRQTLANWTKNPILSAIWGILCGAVSQSSTSSGFFLVSFVSSGMIPLKKAMYILSWADIGTAILVFLASANIKLAILYFIAITGISYSFDKRRRKDAILMACLGLGILLLGFNFVKSSAGALAELAWMQSLMQLAEHSLFFLFILGAVLRLLTQSSSAVTILCIPLIQSGLINLPQAIAIICGTSLGSAFAGPLLGNDLRGLSRQLFYYKSVLYSFTGIFLFSLLIIKSGDGDSYLVKLLNAITNFEELKISYMFLIVKSCPLIFSNISGTIIKKFVAKLSPATAEEEMSKLYYIYDQALENPESAIELAYMESNRILKRLPAYLDIVRRDESEKETAKNPERHIIPERLQKGQLNAFEWSALESLHQASLQLGIEIEAVLSDLFKMNIGHISSERLIKVQNQHQAIIDMTESIYQLIEYLSNSEKMEDLSILRLGMTEGLHNMLLIASDYANSGDMEELTILSRMTSDNGVLMENIRNVYQTSDKHISSDAKALMLKLTNHYQRVVWLIHRWTDLQK